MHAVRNKSKRRKTTFEYSPVRCFGAGAAGPADDRIKESRAVPRETGGDPWRHRPGLLMVLLSRMINPGEKRPGVIGIDLELVVLSYGPRRHF